MNTKTMDKELTLKDLDNRIKRLTPVISKHAYDMENLDAELDAYRATPIGKMYSNMPLIHLFGALLAGVTLPIGAVAIPRIYGSLPKSSLLGLLIVVMLIYSILCIAYINVVNSKYEKGLESYWNNFEKLCNEHENEIRGIDKEIPPTYTLDDLNSVRELIADEKADSLEDAIQKYEDERVERLNN